MATSGSINFTAKRDDVIIEALELCGALGDGVSPTTSQITSCARTLNNLIKAWHNEGIGLDIAVRTFLFLQQNQKEYVLVGNGSDHYVSSHGATTMAAEASAGATEITVADASLISDGDVIGIFLIDNSMHWTTVNGAPVGSVVTLTDALPNTACSGAVVYFYTGISSTSNFRPVDILNVNNRSTSNLDTRCSILTRPEYVGLANKSATGVVSQVWYDRHSPEGNLYVYPTPDTSDRVLVIWIHKTPDDVDVATDDVEFPQEAYLALSFNLASLLSHKYGVDPNTMDRLAARAKSLKDEIVGFDREGSIRFTPRFY